jgi:hypothetical protein
MIYDGECGAVGGLNSEKTYPGTALAPTDRTLGLPRFRTRAASARSRRLTASYGTGLVPSYCLVYFATGMFMVQGVAAKSPCYKVSEPVRVNRVCSRFPLNPLRIFGHTQANCALCEFKLVLVHRSENKLMSFSYLFDRAPVQLAHLSCTISWLHLVVEYSRFSRQ